jgi:dolichol-phosphate mannosyltransferase
MSDPKVMVVIPTYNERENIIDLIEEIFGLPVPRIEAVVVDDQSPDGTGAAAT